MPSVTATPGVRQEKDVRQEKKDQLTPLYNVVLLDDDDHTYEYVIEMLQKLFAFSAKPTPSSTPSRLTPPAAPSS